MTKVIETNNSDIIINRCVPDECPFYYANESWNPEYDEDKFYDKKDITCTLIEFMNGSKRIVNNGWVNPTIRKLCKTYDEFIEIPERCPLKNKE